MNAATPGAARSHILVTGATGFVGRALVDALAAEGRDLTLATRRPAEFPRGRVVSVGTVGPETEWREALVGAGAVVHLAAHVHVAPERARDEADLFASVNGLGSLNLFEQAAACGVPLFVFLSSITVLGSATEPGRPFDDRSPPAPDTPYASSKLDAERALARAASGSGTTLVVLRPPLIAGPRVGGNLGSLARLAARPWPLPLGGIGNGRTLLSIGNLVSAIRTVLDAPRPGTFVLGDEHPLSTSDIVRHLRDGAGRGTPILPAPVGLVTRLAGWAGRGGVATRLFGDLVVDSAGFRAAYKWRDAVGTAETLRATGEAARAGLRR